MPVVTQGAQLSDVLFWEEDRDYSHEAVTLADGNAVDVGTVLGIVSVGAATATAYAVNAADTGTCGTVTVSAGAKPGTYKATIVETDTDAGKFTVEDPDGVTVGTGTVAVAFSGGGLAFTVADGATDFVTGEGFNIVVAPGSGKYAVYDQDASDGTQIAAGVALAAATASGADVEVAALVRHALVKDAGLKWPSDIDADEKTAALASLAALGIYTREAV